MQATAPATADSPKGDASAVGARHNQAANRPPIPDRESMMMEALSEDLGEDEQSSQGTAKTGKEGKQTGSSKGQESTVKGQQPKAAKAGSKKLDLGDGEDEEGEGAGESSDADDPEDEQDALDKAAKAKLNEESGESDDEDEEEQEQEVADEDDAEETDKEKDDKAKGKTGSAGAKVPKGMEDWPPAAIERFQRQDAQVQDLKRQLAIEGIKIEPSTSAPFAHLESLEELEAQIGQAKAWKKFCQENPEGGAAKLSGGKTKELTKEEVQDRLRWAEGILDVDAVSEARERLNYRATHKPWEAAAQLVPDLFDRKSENFKTLASLLQQVPQLRKLNDYEYFVACALKGLEQDAEEKSGAARYVRVEMKDGKPVELKKKSKVNGQESTVKKKEPPHAPNGARPTLKSKTPGKADLGAAEKRFQETRSDDDFAKLVEADMAA